jgi:amidase
MALWSANLAAGIDYDRAPDRTDAEAELFEGLTWGLYEPARRVARAIISMAKWRCSRRRAPPRNSTRPYDVWLSATLGLPPVKLGTFDMDERDPVKSFAPLIDYVPFTAMQNVTGQPAINLPLHWNKAGLPIGVQFVGRFGDETTLLKLAAQLEKAAPWAHRYAK